MQADTDGQWLRTLCKQGPLANGLCGFVSLQGADDGRRHKDEPARGDELAQTAH
jgi:hypothetical protein